MEPLFNNPGYQPIIENIFLTLDHQSILQCRLVNQSWKKHVDKPILWLKKCAQKKSENKRPRTSRYGAINSNNLKPGAQRASSAKGKLPSCDARSGLETGELFIFDIFNSCLAFGDV